MMATACTSSLTRENQHNCNVCAFLLSGKVQGVKLRRYVEAAGRNFQVGGYVINTDDGNVFGEAWMSTEGRQHNGKLISHWSQNLRDFATWIRGEHTPIVYTNVKPTPIGTAYPDLARVDAYCVDNNERNNEWLDVKHYDKLKQFTMVRDDQEAAMLLWEWRTKHDLLLNALNVAKKNEEIATISGVQLEFGAWRNR